MVKKQTPSIKYTRTKTDLRNELDFYNTAITNLRSMNVKIRKMLKADEAKTKWIDKQLPEIRAKIKQPQTTNKERADLNRLNTDYLKVKQVLNRHRVELESQCAYNKERIAEYTKCKKKATAELQKL